MSVFRGHPFCDVLLGELSQVEGEFVVQLLFDAGLSK